MSDKIHSDKTYQQTLNTLTLVTSTEIQFFRSVRKMSWISYCCKVTNYDTYCKWKKNKKYRKIWGKKQLHRKNIIFLRFFGKLSCFFFHCHYNSKYFRRIKGENFRQISNLTKVWQTAAPLPHHNFRRC